MTNGAGYAARHLEHSDYLDENCNAGRWMGIAASTWSEGNRTMRCQLAELLRVPVEVFL